MQEMGVFFNRRVVEFLCRPTKGHLSLTFIVPCPLTTVWSQHLRMLSFFILFYLWGSAHQRIASDDICCPIFCDLLPERHVPFFNSYGPTFVCLVWILKLFKNVTGLNFEAVVVGDGVWKCEMHASSNLNVFCINPQPHPFSYGCRVKNQWPRPYR